MRRETTRKHVSAGRVDEVLVKARKKASVIEAALIDGVDPKTLPASPTAFAEWKGLGTEYFNASAWKEVPEDGQYGAEEKKILQKQAAKVIAKVKSARVAKPKKASRSSLEKARGQLKGKVKSLASQVVMLEAELLELKRDLRVANRRLEESEKECSLLRKRLSSVAPMRS